MTLVKPLTYSELVYPGRVMPILNPREIPVHPKVYGSSLVYKQEFIDEVKGAVPDSVRKDIEAIAQAGITSSYGVNDAGIT